MSYGAAKLLDNSLTGEHTDFGYSKYLSMKKEEEVWWQEKWVFKHDHRS